LPQDQLEEQVRLTHGSAISGTRFGEYVIASMDNLDRTAGSHIGGIASIVSRSVERRKQNPTVSTQLCYPTPQRPARGMPLPVSGLRVANGTLSGVGTPIEYNYGYSALSGIVSPDTEHDSCRIILGTWPERVAPSVARAAAKHSGSQDAAEALLWRLRQDTTRRSLAALVIDVHF
jgi:hypothetical protein